MEKKLTVSLIKEQFNLKVLSNEAFLNKQIHVYGVNRGGLELAGYFKKDSKNKRLLLMSDKEMDYVSRFTKEERIKKYDDLLKSDIPCIVLTSKFVDNELIEISKKHNIPILSTDNKSTIDFTRLLLDFMDEFFAPYIEKHGTLVSVYGKGVLLTGESGIGKSEIALELVNKNHLFVGDDRIVITRRFGNLIAKSHSILQNLVEVRGIGIVDVTQIAGIKSIVKYSNLDIVIELIQFKSNGVDDSDRLGDKFDEIEFLGVKVPYIRVPISSGRNTALIIEYAVGNLKIRETGNFETPLNVISKRMKETND